MPHTRNEQHFKFKPFYNAGDTLAHLLAPPAMGFFCHTLLYHFAHHTLDDRLIIVISALITVMAWSNHTGAHYIRNMLYEMEIRASISKIKEIKKIIRKTANNKAFFFASVFFASLYGVLSFFIPSIRQEPLLAMSTLVFIFTLIGFYTGIAAWSILTVFRLVTAYVKENEKVFDHTAPDQCGGSLFLGDSLLIFSCLALFNGVLFSIFLVEFDFGPSPGPVLLLIKYFWIFLPYLLGILVAAVPAIPVNRSLCRYKLIEEQNLILKIGEIKKSLQHRGLSNKKTEQLQKDYNFYQQVWEELSHMRVWPFHLPANLKYFTFFTSNSVASYLAFGKKALKNLMDLLF